MTRGTTTSRPIASATGRQRVVTEKPPPPRLLTNRPRTVADNCKSQTLSPRELEVLERIARGATNAGIAACFVLSEDTVKSHVKHILQKLGVGNRTEAALHYVEEFGLPGRNGGLRAAGAGAPPATHYLGAPELVATSERTATVAGRPSRDRVVLRMDNGRTVEVPLLGPMFDRLERDSPALVYLDENGDAVGWYLPEAGLGVDLRGSRNTTDPAWNVSRTSRASQFG